MNNYYENNHIEYSESTINFDMIIHDFFLKKLKRNGTILDIGFVSGREYINYLGG